VHLLLLLDTSPETPVRTRLPQTALLAAALLLTACGGSDEESGTDSSAGSGGGEREVLRVATEGTYAPFSFHAADTNELTGYDVEVIEAVARSSAWRSSSARRSSTRSSPASSPTATT
jgi:ABC-type amino acid transport substrate-binding protein